MQHSIQLGLLNLSYLILNGNCFIYTLCSVYILSISLSSISLIILNSYTMQCNCNDFHRFIFNAILILISTTWIEIFFQFSFFQIYSIAGIGWSTSHRHFRTICVNCVHTRLVAMGRVHMHAIRVCEGCFYRCIRFYANRIIERSIFRHRRPVAEISCTR